MTFSFPGQTYTRAPINWVDGAHNSAATPIDTDAAPYSGNAVVGDSFVFAMPDAPEDCGIWEITAIAVDGLATIRRRGDSQIGSIFATGEVIPIVSGVNSDSTIPLHWLAAEVSSLDSGYVLPSAVLDGTDTMVVISNQIGRLESISYTAGSNAYVAALMGATGYTKRFLFDQAVRYEIEARAPYWIKCAPFFSAAANTESIVLTTLAPGMVLHGVKIKHSASLGGGTMSACTVSVGVAGNLAKYAAAFDVFQAPGATVFQLTQQFASEGAEADLLATAVSTDDTLDHVNQDATVNVWVLVSQPAS